MALLHSQCQTETDKETERDTNSVRGWGRVRCGQTNKLKTLPSRTLRMRAVTTHFWVSFIGLSVGQCELAISLQKDQTFPFAFDKA